MSSVFHLGVASTASRHAIDACACRWRQAHAIGATVRFGVAATASRPRHRCASTASIPAQCEQPRWEAAKESGEAYFPPTFDEEGFTHATGVPSRLIETANHFYQDSEAPWVCLRFSRTALRKQCGIIVRDERAMPVGSKAVGENWSDWVCPHVVGGIPPLVVDAVFPMTRDGSKFVSIDGVTDV